MSNNHYPEGQLVRVLSQFTTSSLLTAPIAAGSTVTSLTVSALAAPVDVGDEIVLDNGVNTTTLIASAAAITGATSISVTSQVVLYAFDLGTNVNYPADPTTISLTYQPGKGTTTVVLTYAAGQITRVIKGLYDTNLDTTGKAGVWTYYWSSTGIGQATSGVNTFTVDPTPF